MSLLNICGISEWITVRLAENHKKTIRSDWIAYKYVNLRLFQSDLQSHLFLYKILCMRFELDWLMYRINNQQVNV